MSEGSDRVIDVYSTNPALQRFDKAKIVQTKFFQDIQDESEHFGENIKQNNTYSWYETLESWKPTEDIKETFKKLTQQQNHEIDLCKKDLQNTLRRKGKQI